METGVKRGCRFTFFLSSIELPYGSNLLFSQKTRARLSKAPGRTVRGNQAIKNVRAKKRSGYW